MYGGAFNGLVMMDVDACGSCVVTRGRGLLYVSCMRGVCSYICGWLICGWYSGYVRRNIQCADTADILYVVAQCIYVICVHVCVFVFRIKCIVAL